MQKLRKFRKISLVVPAYKAEKFIAKNLRDYSRVMEGLGNPYEIICVVDGRADKTYENAKKFAKGKSEVRVLWTGYPENIGKGHAVRMGMARAKGDIIGFIDAGIELNPEGLGMLLAHFRWYDADVIVGSKRHPASKINYPWQRQVISSGYQVLTKILFGLRVKDTQVGLKFFKREVLVDVLPRILVKWFAFDIEMLAVAHHLGYTKIYEAPVEIKMNFDLSSTVLSTGLLRNVLKFFWDTAAVYYRLKILKYYENSNKKNWITPSYLTFKG